MSNNTRWIYKSRGGGAGEEGVMWGWGWGVWVPRIGEGMGVCGGRGACILYTACLLSIVHCLQGKEKPILRTHTARL